MFKLPSLMSLALGGALQPRRKTKRPSLRVRDPNDPHQADRIAAAVAKRARKEVKRAEDAYSSATRNNAHGRMMEPHLNPFYINRSATV